MLEINKIYNQNCLDGIKLIDDKSIPLIYCDLPFKMTQNKWDNIIPLEEMWHQFHRIIKDNGVIVLHAMELFSALLISSNPTEYKYKWYWQKDRGTGHLNAKKMPLRDVEEILVFSPVNLGQFIYNPQMTKGEKCHTRGKAIGKTQEDFSRNNNYGSFKAVETEGDMKYPKTLLYFPRDKEKLHETQKPLALSEYMIQTYTNENDIVFDATVGSGTSMLASKKLNRKYLGFESDEKYFKIAQERINI